MQAISAKTLFVCVCAWLKYENYLKSDPQKNYFICFNEKPFKKDEKGFLKMHSKLMTSQPG